MSDKIISYFYHRTKEDIFFGSLSKYSENEIFKIVQLYIQDVVRFLFNEILTSQRVFVPVKGLDRIPKEYSISEIRYYFAGKYIIFESKNDNLKKELIEQMHGLFSSYFHLYHLKNSTLSVENSQMSYNFTQNCQVLHDILPFPSYIFWAFKNKEKSRFKISDSELNLWEKNPILYLKRINLVTINPDIITFTIETGSSVVSQLQELF